MLEDVKSKRLYYCVVILVDWKMKLEPMWYQETRIMFYGKQGMSWHGGVV